MSKIRTDQINGVLTGAGGGGGSGVYVYLESATLGLFNALNVHGPGVTASATGTVADIYIVSSATGTQGPVGPTGPTGPAGAQGNQGSPGVTGAQGIQGFQGSPGVTGATGPQGNQGSPGVTGAQGIQGSPGVTGVTGPQGNQGSPGVTGPQGQQGSPGVTGTAGPQGNQGSPGVTGPQGNQGSPGVTGAQGIQGSQGSPGVTGATGPQGNQGSPGVTGAQGIQGSPGVTGATGPQGNQGSPGVTGTAGPQGNQGSPGVTGATGQNAYNTTATFTQNNGNLVTVVSGAYFGWEQLGQAVYIGTGGYYVVTGISGTNLVLANLASNLPSGTVISASNISPAGIPGTTGATGPQGNQGSPGVTGAQGIQGSPGVTGPAGQNGGGSSGIYVLNNGATLGLFSAINVHGSGVTASATGVTADIYIFGVGGGGSGSQGQNAYNSTPTYTQNNGNLVTVVSGAYFGWEQLGQAVYIGTGGYYIVTGISGSNLVLANIASNLPSGTVINASNISPGGIPGITGATGPQGNQGSPGVTGSQGIQGSPGVTGATGPQGNQGSPGVTGAQGVQGSPGVTGATGPQGNQGSPGVTGTQGVQGSPGVTGVTGPQGNQGSPGVTGATGQNAYNITATFTQNNSNLVTVVSGAYFGWEQLGQVVYVGTAGYYVVTGISGTNLVLANLASNLPSGTVINASNISPGGIPGTTGATGPQGNQGSPGVTGTQGQQGSPGVTGATGPQGNQGSPGVTGTQGQQGSPGVTGATGPQGNQGSPGVTGATGQDAFNSTPTFTQNNGNLVTVVSGAYFGWEQLGQAVYVGTAGYYVITGISGTNLVLANLASNLPSGTVINAAKISPGGIPGTTGATGSQGSQGSPGVTGTQGIQGSPGVTGTTGPQGIQGSPGVTGVQGQQGSPGVTGATGPQGPQGSQGSPGVTGATGQNAYNTTATFTQNNGNLVTVVSGAYFGWEQLGQAVYIGTGGYYVVTGISGTNLVLANLASNLPSGTVISASNISPGGIPGTTGATGPQGSQGSPGVTGTQGVQGSPGVTGATGPQGQQGSPGVTGTQGVQGSPGVTGVTGPQGNQGSPGVTGATGQDAFNSTPTFTQNNGNLVTVVSGAYFGWEQLGQAVYVGTGGYYVVTGISGTNLVLANLASNLPSGTVINAAKISPGGIPGTTGATGPQGNQGSPGVTGTQGQQGSPGVTGATGPQGNQGSPGVTGTQGQQGSPGVTGATGPQGSQGVQGSPGVTGATGATGQDAFNSTATFTQNNGNLVTVVSGAYFGWEQLGQAVYIGTAGYYVVTGISGTNLVLANLASNLPSGTVINAAKISPGGIPGTTGATGPQGNQGSPGVTGSQGVQGSPGVTGATGPQGSQGTQGSPGVTGATGPQGNQGSPGVTGTQGPQGSPGVTGPAGGGGGGSGIYILDGNANIGLVNTINFDGAGVSAVATSTSTGLHAYVYIPGSVGGGGGSGIYILDENANVGLVNTINFAGAGVSAVATSTATGLHAYVFVPAGPTYATSSNLGTVQLLGDLQGINSTASGPTIQRISGDASAVIQIPSGVSIYFGGSIASAAATGFLNFPGFPNSLAPIISYMDNGNLIKVLQIGQNQGNAQQSIEIGNSLLGYMKINNSQWIDLTINDAPAVRIFGPQSPRISMAGNIIEYDSEQLASGPAYLKVISSSNFDIPANDLIINSAPPRSANSTNKSAGNIVLAVAAPLLPQGSYGSVDILNGSSGGYTMMAEFGRERAGGAPYFGLWGPKTATGAMFFQVQSGVASYTLYWPNAAAGTSGFALFSDGAGRLYWNTPGITGPQGSTGPQGLAGASSFWLQNDGVTLGQFNTINLQGALKGSTGPGGTNVVSINTLNDFCMLGVTGANMITGAGVSGGMIQWNSEFLRPTGTIFGHTTIATAAGWVTINKAGYYQIKTTLSLTGVPSGVSRIIMSQFIGATGGSNQFGFGSGSAISQSAAEVTVASAKAFMSNDYIVYIGSGTNIETYVYKIGGGTATGYGGISPTGTYFEIRPM